MYFKIWLPAWLLTVEVIVDKKKSLSFYNFARDENMKQQWLIKINRRNIQSIQHAKM